MFLVVIELKWWDTVTKTQKQVSIIEESSWFSLIYTMLTCISWAPLGISVTCCVVFTDTWLSFLFDKTAPKPIMFNCKHCVVNLERTPFSHIVRKRGRGNQSVQVWGMSEVTSHRHECDGTDCSNLDNTSLKSRTMIQSAFVYLVWSRSTVAPTVFSTSAYSVQLSFTIQQNKKAYIKQKG